MKGIKIAVALTLAAGIAGCATDKPVQTAATHPAPAAQAQPARPAVPPPPPPRTAAAQRAPVQKPAPAPKPATFVTTLSSDASFEAVKPGAKAKLTPAAKAKLDSEVIGKAKQLSRVDVVIVAGHTDRLDRRGQQRSEQQADAVLAHLKSQGLRAPAMDTMGFGKTLPVKECPSTTPKKELAACLAPNRRVVVEVKGMPR